MKILSLFAVLLLPAICLAQKLPNLQERSQRAPADLKIDGKQTEWGEQLQAYNKATSLFYSLANDDENLYVAIMADKPRIIEKIIAVGVTFIYAPSGRKKGDAADVRSFTYPVLANAPGQQIIWYAGAKSRSDISLPRALAERDTIRYSAGSATDSLIKIANTILNNNAKTIKLKGVAEISDVNLSVYNEENIKAADRFDRSGVYFYELAIPLKYLGLSIADTKAFTYSIRLESRLTEPKNGMRTRYIYPNGIMTDMDQDLDSTTDLWGTYTLIK